MPDSVSTDPIPTGRVLPFRFLLDEAANLVRRNFKSFFLPVGLVYSLFALVAYALQISFFGEAMIDPLVLAEGSGFAWYMGLMFASGLAAWLVFAIFSIGGAQIALGRPPKPGQALRQSLRPGFFFTYFGLTLMTFLGIMCCFLPGLVVLMIFGLTIPVMVAEGKTFFAAYGRAQRLGGYSPRGFFSANPRLKLMVFFLVAFALSFGLTWAVQMPIVILQQIMTFRELAAGSDPAAAAESFTSLQWITLPFQAISIFLQSLVQFYVGIGIALLYVDVLRRRDGEDLEEMLDALLERRGAEGAGLPSPGLPGPGAPA